MAIKSQEDYKNALIAYRAELDKQYTLHWARTAFPKKRQVTELFLGKMTDRTVSIETLEGYIAEIKEAGGTTMYIREERDHDGDFETLDFTSDIPISEEGDTAYEARLVIELDKHIGKLMEKKGAALGAELREYNNFLTLKKKFE